MFNSRFTSGQPFLRIAAFCAAMMARVSGLHSSAPRLWIIWVSSNLVHQIVETFRRAYRIPYPSPSDILTRIGLALAVVGPVTVCIWLATTNGEGELPEIDEIDTFIGALLGAQAAVAALTLAVTVFVMQGVHSRTDADERMYAEYVRRSWVRGIFLCIIVAVATTGVALAIVDLVGDNSMIAKARFAPLVLALIAIFAFGANLLTAYILFQRSIRFANPAHWRQLRLDVNKSNIRQGIRVFLGRFSRAVASHATNEPDFTVLFPDPGEGSADEAIRALLDDASRAMYERRTAAFKMSLQTLRDLVDYAMGGMQEAGFRWGAPGTQPEWPPLRELNHNLYSFREEVIREGNRDFVFELFDLDYWLVSNGLRRSCGELFTVGLYGYWSNYMIATSIDRREFHEMIRDRFHLLFDGLVFGRPPENVFPFVQEAINHQERVLSDAMHQNRSDDYERLHIGFRTALSNIFQQWLVNEPVLDDGPTLSSLLDQDYRIVLAGLAGRSIILAQRANRVSTNPYLEVARNRYTRFEELGNDIVTALSGHRRFGITSLWHDWEMRDGPPGEAVMVSPERYPLTFFAVRLMELVDDDTRILNLRGHARQTLDWFLDNAERLEPFVQHAPPRNARQRRENATEVLRNAVRVDDADDDTRIIVRELSNDKITAFQYNVHSAIQESSAVERVFTEAGAIRHVEEGSDAVPSVRGVNQLVPKAFFIDAPDDDQILESPSDGRQWGQNLGLDLCRLLCDSLEEATQLPARLDSRDSLFHEIDLAVQALSPSGPVAFVMAGDWGRIEIDLHGGATEHYEPYWRLPNANSLVEVGRYRGHTILRGPRGRERRLYVIDLVTWGTFVRSPYDGGQAIRVNVTPVSPERALELLPTNAAYFPDEMEDGTKLRKLQTFVQLEIMARHGFQVTNPSRAWVLIPM